MMPLLAFLHAIAARRGDGLRPELIGLLEDQESKSKKRISTTPTREVETLVRGPARLHPQHQEGSKMSREQENKAIVGRWFDGFWGIPGTPESSMNSLPQICFFNIPCTPASRS
jgi:hypothetical protein